MKNEWNEVRSDYKDIDAELKVTGITNLRDIGGYKTLRNKKVKYNCLYRSAPVVFEDDKEREAFSKLNIKSIVDLRSQVELDKVADEEVKGATYYHLSALPEMGKRKGNLNTEEMSHEENMKKVGEYLAAAYRRLPFQNKAYQRMFQLLKEHQEPMLFHCTAGKDRTGVAAALILLALYVSEEDVMEDYMLTNVYRKDAIASLASQLNIPYDIAQLANGVQASYLQGSLDAIKEKYGTYDTYFKEEFGLGEEERALLCAYYCE